MSKNTKTKRLPLVCFCIGLSVFVPLLAGCGNGAAGGNHQMTADDFKNKPIPPEAMKAMQEAQKRAGTQANAQLPSQGAPQGAAPQGAAPK